ncbi:MAG: fasciclin domain-containing protein [Bacteroidia bacterium]
MKKVALPLFVAGALFLAACGGEKKTEATAETTDSTAVTEEGAATEEATASTEEAATTEETTTEVTTTTKSSGSTKSSGTASKKEEAAPTQKIIPTALEIGRFTQLAKCVEATGMGNELGNNGPITLFAPNDEAFAKVPGMTIDQYLKPENKAKLIKVLSLHVTKSDATIEELSEAPAFITGGGKALKVKKGAKGFTVGKANVIKSNIKCTNGMIHEIDAVLLPSDY